MKAITSSLLLPFALLAASAGLVAAAPTPSKPVSSNARRAMTQPPPGRHQAHAQVVGTAVGAPVLPPKAPAVPCSQAAQPEPQAAQGCDPLAGFIEVVSYNAQSDEPVMGLAYYPASSDEDAMELQLSDLADQINLVPSEATMSGGSSALADLDLFEIHIPLMDVETESLADYCVSFDPQGALGLADCNVTHNTQRTFALNATSGQLMPVMDATLLNLWSGQSTPSVALWDGFLKMPDAEVNKPLFGVGPVMLPNDDGNSTSCASPPEGSIALFFVSLEEINDMNNTTGSMPLPGDAPAGSSAAAGVPSATSSTDSLESARSSMHDGDVVRSPASSTIAPGAAQSPGNSPSWPQPRYTPVRASDASSVSGLASSIVSSASSVSVQASSTARANSEALPSAAASEASRSGSISQDSMSSPPTASVSRPSPDYSHSEYRMHDPPKETPSTGPLNGWIASVFGRRNA